MKKTLIFIAAVLLFTTSLFCQEEESDEYEQNTYTENDSHSMQDLVADQNTKKKTFGERLKSSFSSSEKYLSGEDFSLFIIGPTGNLKQHTATTLYHKKNDLYGFGSTYAAAYYMLFVDETNFKLLENSYKKYLSDFENKKLERKGKKTYKAYGSVNATLNWGTIKASTPNHGSGTAFVGYKFINNSPYFAITVISPFYNDYYDVTTSATRESLNVAYYFTKSQMEDFLELGSPEHFYDLYSNTFDSLVTVDSDNY